MPETQSFDLVVIGGGPAGYVGAIRAAQLGLSVACVERDALGGTCLNWGCIPTKALLANAELYQKLHHQADAWGISFDNLGHNWGKIIERSRGVAGQLNKGVGGLFKKNKIASHLGHAFIPRPGVVQVFAKDDVQHQGEPAVELHAKSILIATGAEARALPGTPFDGKRVLNARDAMVLPEQPAKLLIVGSGAIGMEFAYFYNAFGTQCTVVEMQDRLMPIEDAEVSAAIAKAFKKQGIDCHTEKVVESLDVHDNGVTAVVAPVSGEGEKVTVEADAALVAIGVKGRYDGLFDSGLGIETFKDHLKVDYHAEGTTYQTSVPGIYAVGDVIGPPWLAHVASEEAIVCVERLAGHEAPDVDYDSIPGCTYCHPQVASIGLTEAACKEQGLAYDVAKFPFLASGKAQAMGETDGFVKLITGKPHGEVLGAHMIGDTVTELIAEMGLARRLEATKDEIIGTMHAHPTLSEAVHEAALGTDGRMIHF
ncbi:MAG: dihydrolipoyl dehydrogenase [Planctomycetota bacterium]